MNELKQIPNNGAPFMANGKQYFVEENLSIDRWIYMNELTIQLGFGVEYQEMQQNWFNVIDMAEKQKFASIVILAHNQVNGVSKIYEREPMILKFCALFMNTADEDRGTITEDVISRKIEDWKKEGWGIDGFLEFSLLKVKGLAENFRNVIQGDFLEAFQSNQTATK
jgi:hypothetical protein